MELTSKKFIRSLLKKNEIGARENGRVVGGWRPSKGLGQNFLVSKEILKKIIKAAELKSSDIVLEIGPGIGTLTQELAKKVKKVIAVEKDRKMIEILREMLKGLPRTEPKVLVRGWNVRNVEIIRGDILKLDPKPYALKPYKVVANLPYYIVSPVIRKFLESKNPPKEMILMVQKEVAKRICAKPPKMSILAVSVQFYAKTEILFYVSKNSFWPRPKVDGAVIKIVPKEPSTRPGLVVNKNLFFKVVKAGFSQPRKQLVNNLANGSKLNKEGVKKWLLKNKINPTQRAETLEIKDWLNLTRTC